MGEKGQRVVLDPQMLIPAVTVMRMSTAEMEHMVLTLKTKSEEALNSGWFESDRLQGQRDCVEAIVTGCNNLNGLFGQLAPASQQIYDRYLTAETRTAIDQQVATAMQKIQTRGNKDALRKK